MTALNNRFRPRFGIFRLRGFSLTFGASPALKIALRLCLESNPPSRLRYEPSIFRSVNLATRFKAFSPSGGARIRFIDRRYGKRGQHKAVVVDDREDFLPLLMLVAGMADAIATFLRDGVGAIAMKNAEIEMVLLRQMPHAGDECLIERAVVRPFGERFVDCRVVDHGGPVACSGYRQAFLLHTRVDYPQDQIEDAVIAQFAFRPRLGVERCGKINALNSGAESCTGIGVVVGLSVTLVIRQWLHEKPERPSPENPIITYNTKN
jgi:hypothetical protein